VRKPIPFYYGEKVEPSPNERVCTIEKQLNNAREMLATIEREGDFTTHLHGFYVARVKALEKKLTEL
jgi:hypothetical protein